LSERSHRHSYLASLSTVPPLVFHRHFLAALLAPTHSAKYIKSQDRAFADILAYVNTVEAPKYPFAIDHDLAAKGKPVFEKSCSRCHGRYSPDGGFVGEYPNKRIGLDVIGTDPMIIEGMNEKAGRQYLDSWFASQKPNRPYIPKDELGYQAPPLIGVWATAPYLHKGSVPTIDALLDSKSRPAIWTRTFEASEDE